MATTETNTTRPKTTYTYKKYDKLYFICNEIDIDNYTEKLTEYFCNDDNNEFVKSIGNYEMKNANNNIKSTTNFICIYMKTQGISKDVFNLLAKKINDVINKEFKVFIKLSNDVKYTYTPPTLAEKSTDIISKDLKSFLLK